MIIAVIFVVLGYLGNIVGIWQSIENQKGNVITGIAFLLILFGAAGIIWIAIDASNTTDQLKAKSEEIAKLNRDLLTRGDETKDAYKKLALSHAQLIKKSEESLRLSRIVIKKSEEETKLSRENLAQTKLFGDKRGGRSCGACPAILDLAD